MFLQRLQQFAFLNKNVDKKCEILYSNVELVVECQKTFKKKLCFFRYR